MFCVRVCGYAERGGLLSSWFGADKGAGEFLKGLGITTAIVTGAAMMVT